MVFFGVRLEASGRVFVAGWFQSASFESRGKAHKEEGGLHHCHCLVNVTNADRQSTCFDLHAWLYAFPPSNQVSHKIFFRCIYCRYLISSQSCGISPLLPV
jgi:hypothetical protein